MQYAERILRLFHRNRLHLQRCSIEVVTREDYDVDRQHHTFSSSVDAFDPIAAAAMTCQISPIANAQLEWLLPLHLRRRQINVDSFERCLLPSLQYVTGLMQMYIHFKLEQLLLFEGSSSQMHLRRRGIDVIGHK